MDINYPARLDIKVKDKFGNHTHIVKDVFNRKHLIEKITQFKSSYNLRHFEYEIAIVTPSKANAEIMFLSNMEDNDYDF